LQLSDAEMEYVIALAERTEPPAMDERIALPAHLQRLVDAMPFPAFVLATDWDIVGWNAGYAALYPRIQDLAEEDRNLLWLLYTDPQLRELVGDWSHDSRRFLAEFRADAGVRLSSPRHAVLLSRLREHSPDFRAQWAEMAV